MDLVVDGEYLREVRLPTLREALSDLAPAQPITAQIAVCLRRLERPSTGSVISSGPLESSVIGPWKMPNGSTGHRQTGSGCDGAQPVDLDW